MKTLNNKGVSLIELIVAVAMIAICGTMLFNGFTMAARAHVKTTNLQMAEDVAQQIAEEFKTNHVELLLHRYNAVSPVVTTDTVTGVKTIEFNGIAVDYVSRAMINPNAKFTANIKLTSKLTADGTEISRTDGLETDKDTTYKQNSDEATSFYAVTSDVGTNSFIVPEVVNLYDGENVVVSYMINQYDNVVANDLLSAIRAKVMELNMSLLPANQYDINALVNSYTTLYIPYTKISEADQLIKKTTFKILSDNGSDYYYVVDIEYEFNFDFPVYKVGGVPAGTLSSLLSGDLAEVDGAASKYTIKKTGLETYTVSYSYDLKDAEGVDNPESVSGEVLGNIGTSDSRKGAFWGKVYVDPDDFGEVALDIKADGSGDAVPYLYFLYTPFDLYSDSTGNTANDEIFFEYYGPTGANKNIVRTFLVVQETASYTDPEEPIKVENCEIDTSVGVSDVFKVYTNSSDIIDKSSNNVKGTNYLTNSKGEARYNLYDMEIIIFDQSGKQVATYTTTKED